MQNSSRKARGPDLNPSLAGSGPRAGLWDRWIRGLYQKHGRKR